MSWAPTAVHDDGEPRLVIGNPGTILMLVRIRREAAIAPRADEKTDSVEIGRQYFERVEGDARGGRRINVRARCGMRIFARGPRESVEQCFPASTARKPIRAVVASPATSYRPTQCGPSVCARRPHSSKNRGASPERCKKSFRRTAGKLAKRQGTRFAWWTAMRILEARFHPDSKSGGGSIVVGRVHCEGRVGKIETYPLRPEAVTPFEPTALFDKLEFLVGSAVGDTFHALLRLKSGFWSFEEVPPREPRARAEGAVEP
jgi:hypothetical protein